MMVVPDNVRDRWYFVITMPLNIDGHGPASGSEIDKLTWEVWDQELSSYYSAEFLPDAIQECERLNKEYYHFGG